MHTLEQELGINEEDLDKARQMLELVKDKVEEHGRIRAVLGAHYLVPQGGVFQGLADHVDRYMDADFGTNIELFQKSDLGSPPLPRPPSSRPRGRRGDGKPSKPDELSGAVAEYLVYKALHRQLKPWFTSSAWVSSNRRHFFPDFDGDDELGYDFEFTKDGVVWQVEAKAVTGSRPFIDMGPTEVNAARRAARARGSRMQYTIYLVRDPLSNPRILSLGNPYSRPDRANFRIDEGGSRIFFRLSNE